MYLAEDITGPYSGIEYGYKGDMVEVIDDSRPMYLVDNKGVRFFVWPDKLTDISGDNKEPEINVPVEEKKIMQAWLPKEEGENLKDLFGVLVEKTIKKKSKKK